MRARVQMGISTSPDPAVKLTVVPRELTTNFSYYTLSILSIIGI